MKNKVIVSISISILIILSLSFHLDIEIKEKIIPETVNESNISGYTVNTKKISPELSSSNKNDEIISEIFAAKLNNYSRKGFFPQFYEPSLQATYYALFILNVLGKLDQINQTEIVNYILAHYNHSSHIFVDKYTQRYLDTDFSQIYYPLSTILEANCYAVLSLNMLARLDLIDIQGSIDFIWSCYNPESSGFAGQPYDVNLNGKFKIATMDNSYYAISTLNILMEDWVPYVNKKYELIQYISGLQSISSIPGIRGGFSNDQDLNFESLEIFEPNLFSSYYCVKSLEIFSMEDSINVANFKQFLKDLYDISSKKFAISYGDMDDDYLDVVASGIGVALSDISGFMEFDRPAAIDLVLTNRDSSGIWYGWSTTKYHELIDSFEIIRSLSDSGEFSRLSAQEKDQIYFALKNFRSFNGYSLISRDYMSQKLLYIITSACELYDKISDLDLQYYYDRIENSYYYNGYFDCHGFSACVNFLQTHLGFRSRPIEYYNSGTHNLTEEIDVMISHKSTYMALESLKKTFKLDDFQLTHDLGEFVNTVLCSQLLTVDQENFGAFLPFTTYSLMSPEQQNKKIFFEYSYYAIKVLELLASQLGLNITNLEFDKDALCAYIIKNIAETSSSLFFNPRYSKNLEVILQNTYYMIYILKALNRYKLLDWKIKNFVEHSVSYVNIKNLFYSYKISDLLNLSVEFDIELTQNLIQQLYSKSYNEFYMNLDKQNLDQEIFSWICEMAKKDRIRIDVTYEPSIPLEYSNTLSISLGNLILSNFGVYTTVKFESDQLGVFLLDRIDENLFQKSIFVPASSRNYPTIHGIVMIYNAEKKVAEKTLSFNTTYEIICNNQSIVKIANAVKINFNISLITGAGTRALSAGALLTVEIYKDSVYLESLAFSKQDFSKFSLFTTAYNNGDKGNYLFKVFLNDGIHSIPYFIKALTSSSNYYMVLAYSKSIELGKVNTLNATLYNMVSDPNTMVKFESVQFGSITMNKSNDNTYQADLKIPIVPQCYPVVQGNVTVYDNNNKVLESVLSFNTIYGLIYNCSFVNDTTNVAFKVSGSMLAGGKVNPLSFARVEIYKNNLFVEKKYLIRNDFENASEFTLDYNISSAGNYSFKGYLEDGFASEPVFLFDKTHTYAPVPADNEDSNGSPTDDSEDDSNNTDQGESNGIFRLIAITAVVTGSAIGIPCLYFVQKSKAKKARKKFDAGGKSKNLKAVEQEKKEKITKDFRENEDDLITLFLEN